MELRQQKLVACLCCEKLKDEQACGIGLEELFVQLCSSSIEA